MSPSTLLPPAYAAECEALGAVAASARAQLDALRTGQIAAFEMASAATLDAVGVLDRCQSARRRMLAQGAPSGQPEAREALVAAADDALSLIHI